MHSVVITTILALSEKNSLPEEDDEYRILRDH